MNYSIAIVDDCPVVRTFTSFLLTSQNFSIAFEAENGQQCLENLQTASQQPSLVILDVEMPVLDGFKTASILKDTWPDIKIIALSNYDDAATIEKITKAGADFFITKLGGITTQLIKTVQHFQSLEVS